MLPLMIATIDDDADRALMTRIYYRYRRYMYKTIGTFVSDPWDADDVFQTTLPNLIDHLDTLKSLPKNLELNFMTDSLSRKLQRNLRWMSIPFRKPMRYLQKILRV